MREGILGVSEVLGRFEPWIGMCALSIMQNIIKPMKRTNKGYRMTKKRRNPEGLAFARLMMVLSSVSPLFILWAIRGNDLIDDYYFIGFCFLMVVVPNAFLWLRVTIARRQQDTRDLTIGTSDDHRDHILVYLFAMLLPFYSEAIGTWRDFGATLAALTFIVFLFWNLNLHYMNLLFALSGYRVFSVSSPTSANKLSGRQSQVLITKRVSLDTGDQIIAYRLSDTVYMERDE